MIKELHPPQYLHHFFPHNTDQETDVYDDHSKFCAIKTDGKIVGTGRVILGRRDKSTQSFIAQNFSQYFYKDFSYDHIPIEQIAEVSRQYVLPEYSQSAALLAILKGRMTLCAQNGITHLFARMDPELAKKYKSYGLHYAQVSAPYENAGLTHVAYFTRIQALLDSLYEQNSEIWKYVTSDGQYFPYQDIKIIFLRKI